MTVDPPPSEPQNGTSPDTERVEGEQQPTESHRRSRPGRSKKTALVVAQQIVAQITRDGVVLSHHGRRFILPRQ